MIILMIVVQTISKGVYDSQDEILQFISLDSLDDSFSIWFKLIETKENAYNIISIFKEDYYYFHFITFDLRNRLTFCLDQDECKQVYGIQQYQNAHIWFQLIISNIIKIEEPIQKILFQNNFLQYFQLFLLRSPYYRCLIYQNLSGIKKQIKSFNYEKIVRPQESLDLFTEQSVIQIFLRKTNQENQCNNEDYLLKLNYQGLFDFKLNEKDCQQLQWNNISLFNFSFQQVSQWFQIQLMINYQDIIITFILVDFTYTDKQRIQKFETLPLYYNLVLNLQSVNYVFQSSNYYQFYNHNEINLCHSYCQDCQNNTCLSCYVKDCECQSNQFFNIINKSCQFYSQISNIMPDKKEIICQKGFAPLNYLSDDCLYLCFVFEGQPSKECYFDFDDTFKYFQFQEDLLFRQIYLDPQQQNLIYSQSFNPSKEPDDINYEILDDLQILLMKNKNLFLLSFQQNGYKICRYNYFGNNCQFKPFKCLYSNNQNCQICQPYYYLLGQQKCKKCPKHCMLCEYDKKKVICLFAQENYYLNELGIPKFCPQQCYMCKKDGSCINQQEIIQQIVCNKSDCVQQIKLECDITNSIIIELAQQKCQRIYQSSNVFQWIQSVILSDLPFLGEYKIPFKQQLVVNSLNSNNTQVYFNKQANLIYKFEQLKQIYYLILNDSLVDSELYDLQMKGLFCTQKYIHEGQIRCLNYQQNNNTYEYKNTNLSKNYKYSHNLTLNVLVILDNNSYIICENQKYLKIMDLLFSIKNLGMDYGFVRINASLILKKQNQDYGNLQIFLKINKTSLPKFLRHSLFQIVLYYDPNYNYENKNNALEIRIAADYIQINNMLIKNDMIWKIKCDDLMLNDTQIKNISSINFQINAVKIIIIDTVIMDSKDITFQSKEKNQHILISNLTILKCQFYETNLFQMENTVEFFILYGLQIKFCTFMLSDVLHFEHQIRQQLKITKLNLLSVQFNQSSIIIIKNIAYFQIIQSKFYEIKNFGKQPLFNIQQLDNGSIIDFSVYQSKFQVLVFNITHCQMITFQNVLIQMTAITFVKFIGNKIYLINFQIFKIEKDELKIFYIQSIYSLIENLEFIQEISNEIKYDKPYFIVLATVNGLLNNLKFVNIQMIGSGLIYLENSQQLQIQNIVITNCSLIMSTQNLPNFINILNFGSLTIQNIQIKQLDIKNDQMNEQFELFSITGINDEVILSDILIENVITNNLNNIMFSLQNYFFIIFRFKIYNIISINPFYIYSQNTQFEYGQITSLSQSNIFVVAQNAKKVNKFINIEQMQINQLNGGFIKNKLIGENYTIILKNIQMVLSNPQNQIDINLKNTDLYLFSIKILQDDTQFYYLKSKYQDINLLAIQQVRLYVQYLTIINVLSNLGEFQSLTSTHIVGLFIYNINQMDKNDKQQQIIEKIKPYISFFQNSSLILRNIHIFNSSFYFNDIIQLIIYDGSVTLNKFYFYNNAQIKTVLNFLFPLQNKNNNFYFYHIFVYNINAQNLFQFDFYSLFKKFILINNLFFSNNTIKYLFENLQNKIYIKISHSLLYNVVQIFNQKQNFELAIINSEIINQKNLDFYQAIIKNSLIFDEITQQFKIQYKFSIDISFNKGQSLLRKKQIDQNTFQINLNNNQEQFIYLPSGQPITNYERLDLKNIQYKQIYSGFSLVVKGLQKEQIKCEIKSTLNGNQVDVFNQRYLILNQSINLLNNLTAFINPFNKDYVTNDIICDSYILRFNVKGFKCQLGEYLYNNTCLQCETQKGLYSTQYNSTHCQNANYNQISQLNIGLVQLRQNYWRYSYNSIIIEQCQNEHCQGGWKPGDSSCNSSRIGALCQECDIYNKQGNGYYTKNLDNCQICEVSYRLVYQFILSILWQLFLTFMSIYSKDSLSKQLLFYKVGKRNFYKVLYKLSLDQPAVILKMLTNYLFYIYLIRENFNSISQFFILNLNLVNNPSLIMEAQLDCIFRQFQNIEIIYVKFLFSLCNLLFITNIHFMVYLLYVKIGNKFQFKILLFIIVEIFIFNLQIILEICFKLLSYQELSQIKWIQLNLSYQYYSSTHISMIYQLIIPLTIILLLLPIIILCLFIYNFTIMKSKIFSLFEQKYKTGQQYWGFITIYTKFIMMAISIINKKLSIFQVLFTQISLFILWIYQPYHFQNLNQIDWNLQILYEAVIHCLMLTDSNIIFLLIFFININPIIGISNQLIYKLIQLNREQILENKQLINNKYPKLGKYISIEKDQRIINNQQVFRDVVRQKFLTSSKFYQKSQMKLQSIQNAKTQEIELGTLQTVI